jgi:hypothetical protein
LVSTAAMIAVAHTSSSTMSLVGMLKFVAHLKKMGDERKNDGQ